MRGKNTLGIMIWKSIQTAVGAIPDGIPGSQTGAAIAEKLNIPSGDWKSIQRSLGLSPDGIPDKSTAIALVNKLGLMDTVYKYPVFCSIDKYLWKEKKEEKILPLSHS